MHRLGGAGDSQQPVDIDRGGGSLLSRLPARPRGVLLDGHESEVPLFYVEVLVVPEAANHLVPNRFGQCVEHHPFVGVAADLVQEPSGDVEVGVEVAQALQDGCRRARHAPHVHH
jgi:hypothetical protein